MFSSSIKSKDVVQKIPTREEGRIPDKRSLSVTDTRNDPRIRKMLLLEDGVLRKNSNSIG